MRMDFIKIQGLHRFPGGNVSSLGAKSTHRACPLPSVLILLLIAWAGSIQAAPITATWRPGSVGEWTDNNWDFNPGVPGTIYPNNNGNTYTVNIDQPGAGDDFLVDNGIPSRVNLSRAVTVDSVSLTDHLVIRNGGQLKVQGGMVVRDECGFDCVGGALLEVRGAGSRLEVRNELTNSHSSNTIIADGGSIHAATYTIGTDRSSASTVLSNGSLTADTLNLVAPHSARVGSRAAALGGALCPEIGFGLSLCLQGHSTVEVRHVAGFGPALDIIVGHGSNLLVREGLDVTGGHLEGSMSIGGNLQIGGDLNFDQPIDVLSAGEAKVGGSFRTINATIHSGGHATVGGSFFDFLTNIESGGVLTARSVEAFELVGAGRIEVNSDAKVSVEGSTNPTGVLTIVGNYEDGLEGSGSFGTLFIEIGGRKIDLGIGVAEYDRLDVTNNAIINGRIVIALAGGFEPTAGDVFDVLLAGDIIGNPVFELPILLGGLHFVSSLVEEGGRMALRLTAVPEPGTLSLFFLTSCLLLAVRTLPARRC